MPVSLAILAPGR